MNHPPTDWAPGNPQPVPPSAQAETPARAQAVSPAGAFLLRTAGTPPKPAVALAGDSRESWEAPSLCR
jgi:hypothetical protein